MGVYDDKTPSVVTPYNGSTVSYGWPTNIDEADRAALGHQTLAAATGPVVFGASRPKPARLTRERVSGDTGSFVDWQSYNSAIAAGWKKSKGALYGPSPYESVKSIRVVAEVATGLSVAWDMRKTQYTRIQGDLAGLGIEVLNTTNGRNAVVGANSIQGASIFGAKTREGNDTLSVGYVKRTAVDNLPDGWSAVEKSSSSDPTIAAP
ncbi:MAG: hypothetical protein AAFY54_01850 [Cyanobacteria bacterium J06648_10]